MLPPSSDRILVTLHKLLAHISLTIGLPPPTTTSVTKLALSEIYTVVHLEKIWFMFGLKIYSKSNFIQSKKFLGILTFLTSPKRHLENNLKQPQISGYTHMWPSLYDP